MKMHNPPHPGEVLKALCLEPLNLSVTEVAVFLGCSKAHVCKAIQGRVTGVTPLPAISMGRRKLVRRQSLNAWLLENEPTPASGILDSSHKVTL